MLRPQFQRKLRLAFLMLASALILLAEPVFARRENRSSSANQNAQQQAASKPSTPAPAPAPKPAPAARSTQSSSRSVSRPQTQTRSVVSTPTTSVRPQSITQSRTTTRNTTSSVRSRSTTQSRATTSTPSSSVQSRSSTQSRVITNRPTTSVQSRSTTTNTGTTQSQTRSNNSISTNRSVTSRPNTTTSTPSINNRTTISSSRTNSIGSSIGSGSSITRQNNSISTNRSISSRTNTTTSAPSINNRTTISSGLTNSLGTSIGSDSSRSITNRQTTRTNTNNSISRNNVISNRSRETANPSSRAPQPVESPNTRISSELSSHIGDTIGTQPKSTANIRMQESRNSREPVYLPFDRQAESQRTSPQTTAQQPAESSNNRINSENRSRIGTQIGTENNSLQRNTRSEVNRVTPPSSSDRQPVENIRSRSSLDRANTEIGTMISPERTSPNESRQPAANPNNRTSRDNLRIGSRVGEQENSRNNVQRRNVVGDTNRVNSVIGESARQKDLISRVDKQTREDVRGPVRDTSTRINRRVDRTQSDRTKPDSIDQTRISRVSPETRTTAVDDLHVRDSSRRDLRVHRYEPVRPTRIIVRDRPYVRDTYHDSYLYVDLHNQVYRTSVTPDYYVRICYDRGSWLSVRYVYPYYQRKYVFVSLGGYWPTDYSYVRYYWYGSHPYHWYGYYPVARQVSSDVNYYTYNYYYNDNSGQYDPGQVLDSDYFDTIVRNPAPQPAEATLADTYFEEAVNAFENGKYDLAIEKFSRAMALAPDDMILPYAYSQALFAAERYSEAAEVLRAALSKIKPEQEGVFYPRGLYPDDEILLAQLDKLAQHVEEYSFDADLQLLLGYQLLGIGELDEALEPLKNASHDMVNRKPANVLLNLLLKIKVNDITSGENIEPEKIEIEEPEPDMIQLNHVEPESQNLEEVTIVASTDSALEAKNESDILDKNGIMSEEISSNEPTNKKAKEGVLLATLFVLAGSTGLGHFLHR